MKFATLRIRFVVRNRRSPLTLTLSPRQHVPVRMLRSPAGGEGTDFVGLATPEAAPFLSPTAIDSRFGPVIRPPSLGRSCAMFCRRAFQGETRDPLGDSGAGLRSLGGASYESSQDRYDHRQETPRRRAHGRPRLRRVDRRHSSPRSVAADQLHRPASPADRGRAAVGDEEDLSSGFRVQAADRDGSDHAGEARPGPALREVAWGGLGSAGGRRTHGHVVHLPRAAGRRILVHARHRR